MLPVLILSKSLNLAYSPADVFGTVVRFVTSAVVVPITRLTQGSLPEDGEAACKAAMQREADREQSKGSSGPPALHK